jgi:hypothetical protein
VNPTDWILIAVALAMLILTAWYKGVFGRMFAAAPISILPTSPEQMESVWYLEKGVLMAIQEGHREVAKRMAIKVQQEVVSTIAPPLSPSPSPGLIKTP